MTYGTVNADLMTTSDGVSSAGLYGFKNRIINGAMTIDQRNAGASVTAGTTNPFSVDRWQTVSSQNSKYTAQQNAGSVTPPTGFINYLGITSSSAYSVLTGDYFAIQQIVEGLNVADLAWGTANAAPITISFWVRSSLTGTFGGSLTNNGSTRAYPFSYTISSTNTWEQKSVTIAGDTSGTWLTTNGIGIRVVFGLGVGTTYSGTAGSWAATNYVSATGATSVVGTSGATFYITGVQLEKGSTATSFDYRPYGTELQLCQRYYASLKPFGATYTTNLVLRNGAAVLIGNFNYPTTMRTLPTIGGITSWVTTTPASSGQVAGYISRLASYLTITGALTNGSTGTVQNAQIIMQAGTSFGGATAGDTIEMFSYELTASAEL